MPSASVAELVALAGELRLLPDADLARLAETPDADDLPTVCRRLVASGAFTRYQADRILTGRGYTLAFAGFPLLDELDATTFRAIDPTTRAEVRLSRFDVPPSVDRSYPGQPNPLASGQLGTEAYVVHRRPDGADLAALIADMGPMPAKLAGEYVRQAAAALATAHAAGVVHARVRPDRLFVGPLVQASKPKPDGSPRLRPGPTATVSVTDYGQQDGATPADDVFALGGVLFHLLTGRQPGEVSLSTFRSDCPPELVTLTKSMLALAPGDRPTMAEVGTRLTALLSPAAQPDVVPLGNPSDPGIAPANVELAETEQVELVDDSPQLALASGWAGHPAMSVPPPPAYTPQAWSPPAVAEAFPEVAPSHDDAPSPRRSRASTTTGGSRQMLWLLAGAFVLINLLAVIVWVLMILNPFAKK